MSQFKIFDSETNFTLYLKEESKDFYRYLNRINKKNNILDKAIVLPKNQSFYYDTDEIKNFDTIVYLKKLNYIKKLNNFLDTLQNTTEKNTYFAGCFINNKRPKNISGNNKWKKYFKYLLLILDSLMAQLLSEKNVVTILKAHEFEIIDMKEIRGITYFYAKKV